MLHSVKANLNALRALLARLRRRGYGSAAALLYLVPRAASGRLYAKFAGAVNAFLLAPGSNQRRFRRFQQRHAGALRGHLYLIVMPRMLHFLMPCVRLIPPDVPVIFIGNGQSTWEEEQVRALRPDAPFFNLATLPRSSLAHGHVIDMLLQHNEAPFGIVDHDLYMFDESIFRFDEFAADECMRGIFRDVSARTGLAYPQTHFLFLNTPVLRGLMERYRVHARLYRSLPRRLARVAAKAGVARGGYLKDYHDFFDTLHVLLVLAYAEGYRVGFIELAQDESVFHVGGTSIGSLITKDLPELYLQWRFLELADQPALRERYGKLLAPFGSSGEIRRLLPRTPRVEHLVQTTDRLVEKLSARWNQRNAQG
ncbi:MAG: hypothetical protein ACSLEZ_07125 [Thiobacillus sp.]